MSQQSPPPSPASSVSPLQIMDVLLKVPQFAHVSQLGVLRQVNHEFKKEVDKDDRLQKPDNAQFTNALIQDAPFVAKRLHKKFERKLSRPGYATVGSMASNPKVYKWLHKKYPGYMTDNGFLPVHHAVFRPQVLKEMLALQPELARRHTVDNFTLPIHLAIQYNIPDSLEALLKADPTLIQETGIILPEYRAGFENLLFMAAFYGSTEVAKVLLEHISPNVQNSDGETPLHNAVAYDNPAMVDVLLKHGASPAIKDRWGETPLDLVIGKDYEQEIRAIFQKYT